MSTIREIFGCGNSRVNNREKMLIGIECEIEAIPPGMAAPFGGFDCKKDGSLRNNGYEYITMEPATRQEVVADFTELHKALKLNPAKDPFSHRTSTHVHVNCVPLEDYEVKNLILLYALFEEFFFSMAKPERRNNIHCVPLTETYLPSIYKSGLPRLRDRWHKYTALNICRLTDLGTVEFRHLHGTGDADELNTWLSVLENTWTLAQKIRMDEASLTNKATIEQWFTTIFSPSPRTMMMKPTLFSIISNSLIDVKFSTIIEQKKA